MIIIAEMLKVWLCVKHDSLLLSSFYLWIYKIFIFAEWFSFQNWIRNRNNNDSHLSSHSQNNPKTWIITHETITTVTVTPCNDLKWRAMRHTGNIGALLACYVLLASAYNVFYVKWRNSYKYKQVNSKSCSKLANHMLAICHIWLLLVSASNYHAWRGPEEPGTGSTLPMIFCKDP